MVTGWGLAGRKAGGLDLLEAGEPPALPGKVRRSAHLEAGRMLAVTWTNGGKLPPGQRRASRRRAQDGSRFQETPTQALPGKTGDAWRRPYRAALCCRSFAMLAGSNVC